MSRLDTLIQRQHEQRARMQEIQNRAEEEDRDWTAEERTNWDAAHTELETVSGDIERLEQPAKLEKGDRPQVLTAPGPGKPRRPRPGPGSTEKCSGPTSATAWGS